MNNQVRILEGLRENFNTEVNENVGKYLEDNIDKKKYESIEKLANKYGYTFSSFQVHRYVSSDKLSVYITVANKSNDKLLPQITTEQKSGKSVFYVYPSFMGALSSTDAKRMAENIKDAAAFVDYLNRTNFADFMTKDNPE
jgi:hypothetical protein